MSLTKSVCAVVGLLTLAAAGYSQVPVKHLQPGNGPIAQAVWAGDTLYVSGQLATPITADGTLYVATGTNLYAIRGNPEPSK